MIVPDYWAEARKQDRSSGKQITVRRFGWSMRSKADALSMAENRAEEALTRLVSGEKLARREAKVAYNGAFGVPIREEVLARHGEEAITRNSYGAHCLNTPRALFADVDFSTSHSPLQPVAASAGLAVVCAIIGFLLGGWRLSLGMMFIALILADPILSAVRRLRVAAQGGPEFIARRRLQNFLGAHPSWNVRLYRTPAGFRLLATQQPFEASAPEVQQFFSAVGADPVYVRMCLNQQCFRARLTAKPWRIGIAGHMRPRPGVWPVRPERLQAREQWVAAYERAATGHAACHFVESLGSGVVHPEIGAVVELHDRLSRAGELALKIA